MIAFKIEILVYILHTCFVIKRKKTKQKHHNGTIMELNGSWGVANLKPGPDLMKNLYKFEQAKPMDLEFIQFHVKYTLSYRWLQLVFSMIFGLFPCMRTESKKDTK